MCFAGNVQYPTFDERRMRSHLAKCFNEGKMTPFPKAMVAMNLNCVVHKEPIRVYCSCRMPEHFDTVITCVFVRNSFKCARLNSFALILKCGDLNINR